jgi:hypothetical protein
MFGIWRLKRRVQAMKKKVDKEVDQLDPKSSNFHDEVVKRVMPFGKEYFKVGELIDQHYSQKLCDEARKFDVEIPESDEKGMWRTTPATSDDGDDIELTPKGRSTVRKLIDAEKARRFEVRTLWVMKFWLPLLAALVGIIGSLTGLVAILQHKK